ncbi:MAG: Smr/MutS family protein [Acidobacteria bacterium]|nr:Smr/MutS family protein [Acidobacteriota bacterium]MBI3656959.1 Smr/MutS family protein [Acidobacteriota bacterium]
MSQSYYKPFQVLKSLVVDKKPSLNSALPTREEENKCNPMDLDLPLEASDEEIFHVAMKDVVPLGWSGAPDDPTPSVQVDNPSQTEDDALRLLEACMQSDDSSDLSLTHEYVEKAVQPIGPWVLRDLHCGRFAVQAYLDLHGFTVAEARLTLERFIRECIRNGFSCVRIVHGRGHHSLNGNAVLKAHVQHWLGTRRWSRHVVAYATARRCDGGGGALYVLLRQARKP